MPPLKKLKWEKFCLNYYQTCNASKSAVLAGYSVKGCRVRGTELLARSNIKQRLAELRSNDEAKATMSVRERKERLSEIGRAKLTDFMELGRDGSWVNLGQETENGGAIVEIHSRTEYDENGEHPTVYTSVKLHDPIRAIQELNKMEKVYEEGVKVNVDQRQVIFQVVNTETKDLIYRIQNGERTETLEADKDIPSERGGLPEPENQAGAE